jgi:lysophospholipase L1-like esterase
VAGDGNADAFIGSDGIHPTDAGAAYWASRIAARIAAG